MKTIYTVLFTIFLTLQSSSQATGGLQFDGVNDYASINVRADVSIVDTMNQSLRLIFKANPALGDMTLLSQHEGSGSFLEVGIDSLGSIYMYNELDSIHVGDNDLNDGLCHEVVLSFSNGDITAYVDKVKYNIQKTQFVGFSSQFNLTLGASPNANSNFFDGVIEDVLWRRSQSTDAIVSSEHFKPLIGIDTNKVLYLSLWNFTNSVTTDPYFGANQCLLGGVDGDIQHRPIYVNTTCMQAPSNVESIGGACSGYAGVGSNTALAMTPNNPDEFIFNGGFEEYCPGLGNPSAGMSPEHAFYSVGKGTSPTPYSKSDVAAWYTLTANQNSSDFFVRNGLGDIPSTAYVGMGHPMNTRDGNGNAIVGFMQLPYSDREFIQQSLTNTLTNGATYVLSYWAYTKSNSGGRGGSIFLSLVDNNKNEEIVLEYMPTITSSSIPDNNGWQYIQKEFTVPDNGTFESARIGSNTGQLLGLESYIFLDEVSIVPGEHKNFPQWIGSTPLPDSFDYNVLIDNDGFVYVMGTQQNAPIGSEFGIPVISSHSEIIPSRGYFVAKYDGDGSLIWTENFYNLEPTGIALSDDGQLIVVGAVYDVDIQDNLIQFMNNITQGASFIQYRNVVLNGYYGQHPFVHIIDTETSSSKLNVFASSCNGRFEDVYLDNNSSTIFTRYIDQPCNGGNTPWLTGNSLSGQMMAMGSITSSGTFTPTNAIPITGGPYKDFEVVNGNFFLLSNSTLSKHSGGMNFLSSVGISNAERLIQGNNGNLFVITAVNQTHNQVKMFDASLAQKWSFNTQSIFGPTDGLVYQIAEGQNEVIVGGFTDAPSCGICAGDLWFASVNSSDGSMTGWVKQSTQNNASMNGSMDFKFVDASYDRIIFASGFVPTYSSWDIILDNERMSGTGVYTPHPDKNIVVSDLVDITSGSPSFKHDLGTSVKAYPNPFTGRLTLLSESVLLSITITDVHGNEVLKIQELNTRVHQVDLSGIANGIYLVEIQTGDGVVLQKAIKASGQ